MTAPALDDFMLRLAPAPPMSLEPALARARDSINTALVDLRAVADASLERGWPWRDGEADVRYGFYRQYEALEGARAQVRRLIAGGGSVDGPARPLVGAATAARWDIHGLLAGLAEADLDRDPGNGEWTLRQTLAHIVGGQRAYGWFTTWWLDKRTLPEDEFPTRVPDKASAALPDEDTEALGSLTDIRSRLDDIVDLSAGVFASLGDEELAARARWSGMPVDVKFRVTRWSSHMREHTIQLEKTLEFIERQTSEVERLVRLVAAAYGRLEEELFMRRSDEPGVGEALVIVETVAAGAASDAKSVVAAAGR